MVFALIADCDQSLAPLSAVRIIPKLTVHRLVHLGLQSIVWTDYRWVIPTYGYLVICRIHRHRNRSWPQSHRIGQLLSVLDCVA
jgi:hypothetical protein